MKINEELVDHLAHLARLEFDAESKTEIMTDLNRILGFVEKLNEINTEGVEPLIYMVDQANLVRNDIAAIEISTDEALKNAPRHDSDFFRVPKVIE